MKSNISILLSAFVLTLLAFIPGLLRAQHADTCQIRTTMRQLSLTCSNGDSENGSKAQVKVTAEGGVAPYTYEWESGSPGHWSGDFSPLHIAPNDPSKAIGLRGYRWFRVKVTDSRGCSTYDSIYTKAYPTPNVVISCDPGDTVYIQNPDVTFSFENLPREDDNTVVPVESFFWTFEQNITSTQQEPTFTYVEASNVPYQTQLTVVDDCGCDTTFVKEFYVLPVKLKIPSVFTPNDDGFNDTFVISLASGSDSPGGSNSRSDGGINETPLNAYYKSTELMVMNRWGHVVYKSDDYQNDWDGGGLPDGTYFYVLKCKGLKEEVQYQGAVMILTKTRN